MAPKVLPAVRRFLSLRWKAVIALSLTLMLVNASLAWLAHRQSASQFELRQANLREQQNRQLHALLDDGYQGMSKLASFIPLLESAQNTETLTEHLQRVLGRNGALLDLEWDIRSVHLIEPEGHALVSWPDGAPRPPTELRALLSETPEARVAMLLCRPDCRQYLATPILWRGRFAGTLVLSRSLADSILTFNMLTGADVAILTKHRPANTAAGKTRTLDGTDIAIPALTNPPRTEAVLQTAQLGGVLRGAERIPITVPLGREWYEVFRLDDLAQGVHAFVINQVTTQRAAIRSATRDSVLIGIIGLVLSETLLLLVLHTPVSRIRRLVAGLPLLAENRFGDLRQRLPSPHRSWTPADEIDVMVTTVQRLTVRMEGLQRQREEAESQLLWLADHDPLTSLFNRRRFTQDFERVIAEAARYDHTGALLFFDLDHFKDVNDLSGHQAGDRLLQRIAEQLDGMVRSSDLLGRLGGDEFALVLPESDAEHATMVAERIQALTQGTVLASGKHQHRVSASIGIVLFPKHGTDAHRLLANADLAMYQAKENGRGRHHLFSQSDHALEKADARVLWTHQIDEALEHDRFDLAFQPIIALASAQMHNAEALLRMRGRDGETIAPGSFIPVAESTGRIQAIDRWVLRRAIETMARNPRLDLSVNLSAGALEDDSLMPALERLLDGHDIDAERLTLELTETAAVNSLLHATRLMHDIQALGCRFALDDFGSGFASYAYLRRLPIDTIKIDGEFIRGLAASSSDRVFVRSISDVAHSIGMRVVAECVEDQATLDILADLNIELAQGYHLARPMPERALRERMSNTR